jgi:hypothetical protein
MRLDPTRRELLRAFALAAGAGLVGFGPLRSGGSPRPGYGDPIPDPAGVLDLPRGFEYRMFSQSGEEMDDGLLVPENHDGMGAFRGTDGRVILVRNHEITTSAFDPGLSRRLSQGLGRLPRELVYDRGHGVAPGLGGTVTLVFDPRAGKLERHFRSLAGTYRNCAGGVTPWQSWISCEECPVPAGGDAERDHGYAFEVPASARGPIVPVPLRALGRFNREAVAVDPRSGCVYQTEDRYEALLYRFVPDAPRDLARGGRLQALRIRDLPGAETHNREGARTRFEPGRAFDVDWVDLDRPDAPDEDLRFRGFARGAARFVRGEGIGFGSDGLRFTCTEGGAAMLGQIFRYRPSPFEGRAEEARSPGRLDLVCESTDALALHYPDNLTIAPWGDLFVCEDAPRIDRVLVLDARGELAVFARHRLGTSEFAGVTFSPDGDWLFVNVQDPGATFAIRGPWRG